MSALKEAQTLIMQDKEGAAKVLLEAMGAAAGSTADMLAILNDPSTKYTTQPENVMKYALFMNDIGSLKNRPALIEDLFFSSAEISLGH